MPSQEAPDDDDVRQTYNFAPGYYGLVYRADVPDRGAGRSQHQQQDGNHDQGAAVEQDEVKTEALEEPTWREPQYKLQAMKWGLIPFWTKRSPDYGSMMRTINCRDDSLATPGGMWHTMKQKKRCIVVAQGFYEWLKKNGGKEKIPHYVKRKDGQLMCFAGLWDCVRYEDAEEKLYTYAIITTDSNKQINFLHDRMPVILNNGSDDVFTWLDSNRSEWSKELQSLLKPFDGELECYPVSKDVGKVGNNSPTFIVPIASAENKQNIVNFFGNQKTMAKSPEAKTDAAKEVEEVNEKGTRIDTDAGETRETAEQADGEKMAPKPVTGVKRQQQDFTEAPEPKSQKTLSGPRTTPKKSGPFSSKQSKSATSNAKTSPVRAGDDSKKITSFFGK